MLAKIIPCSKEYTIRYCFHFTISAIGRPGMKEITYSPKFTFHHYKPRQAYPCIAFFYILVKRASQ